MKNDNLQKTRNKNAGDLEEQVGFHISALHMIAIQGLKKALSELSIAPPKYVLMTLISNNPGISQMELCLNLGYDKTRVASSMFKLEKRKLLKRVSGDKDRRLKKAYLTEKGELLLEQLSKIARTYDDSLTKNLSSQEKVTLLKLMNKLYQ